LSTIVRFVDQSSPNSVDGDLVKQGLMKIASQFEVGGQEDIQFSVVDLSGRILYHDWPELVWANWAESSQDPNLFDQCLQKPFGAFAWTDYTSNLKDRLSDHSHRRNIGVFARAAEGRLVVVVEVHFAMA